MGSGPRTPARPRGDAVALTLVPRPAHVEAELGRREGAGNVRVFQDFVAEVITRLAREVIPAAPHAVRLLTAEALGEIDDARLRWPDEAAARAALSIAMDQAIGRLRRAAVTAAHLRALATPRAAVIAEVIDRIDARLAARGLVDPRSLATIAALRLREAPRAGLAAIDPTLLTGRAIVAGMVAFEPDDLAVIEALHARLRADGGAGVSVVLPRLSTPDDPVAIVAGDLQRRWAELDDAPEIVWIEARAPHAIQAITARDADGEARAVVAAVLTAFSRGAAPERIAILVPALDEARISPLRAALTDARVPFAEPQRRPAASDPAGRIVLGLLAIARGPVTREQVIELLRAPGLHLGAWMDGESAGEAASRAALLAHRLREVPVEIDRTGRLLALGLHDLIEARRRNTARARRAGPQPDEGWMLEALERLLADTRALAEAQPSRKELVSRLFSLTDRLALGRPEPREIAAALRADRHRGGLALRALGDSSAAVRALREAAQRIVEAAASVGLAERSVAADELASELEIVAAELGEGGASSAVSAGAVRIALAADLAAVDHDLLVITGLEEQSHGAHQGDESLLDERLRRALPAAHRPLSARDREVRRRAELGLAIASAARVITSFCTGDEGELASPHGWFRWSEALGADRHQEPISRVARQASPIDARSAELCALARGGEPRPEIAERARIERIRAAYFLDPRAPAHAFSGRVDFVNDEARARFITSVGGDARERPVAVTAIERAAGCAFAGFARRVLHVRSSEDLGEPADARERGTLVHRALEYAFEGVREHGLGAAGGDDPARLLAAARAHAEAGLGLPTALAPLRREAIDQAVTDAVAVVARALHAGGSMRFLHAEQSFGSGDAWPALALHPGADEDPDGPPAVWVDGQIDRIDVALDGSTARVVDYKTGKIPAIEEQGRTAFQLPLYAAVVAQQLGVGEVSALYVAVRQRGFVDEQPRGDEARRALGARRVEAAIAARRVMLAQWRGEVDPRPAKATLCARCEARDVCRRPAAAPIDEAAPRS
jgi:ATP-dependent helicase/nuclease subunit B